MLYDLLLDLRRERELYHKLCEGVGMGGPNAFQRCYDYIDLSKRTIEQYKELDSRRLILQEFLDGVHEMRYGRA
jgi:hypothetical protein